MDLSVTGYSIVLNEINITLSLLSSNWTAHCGNSAVCFSARSLSVGISLENFARLLPGVAMMTFAFSYAFDIANQAFSVEEDAINKPDRPIVSGRLSIESAYARWFLTWTSFPVVAHFMVNGSAATMMIIWELWVLVFYVWPKLDHWAARNLFTAVGAIIQLSLLDAFLTRFYPDYLADTSLGYLLFWWLVLTIHVQEFHDMEGDRATGRRTLPLLIGPRHHLTLRVATATGMIIMMVINILRARAECSHSFYNMPTEIFILAVIHLETMAVVAVRLIMMRWKEADRLTYKYYYTLATYAMLLFSSVMEGVTREL